MLGRNADVVADPIGDRILGVTLRPVGFTVAPHHLKRVFPGREAGVLADHAEVSPDAVGGNWADSQLAVRRLLEGL